MIIHSPFDGYTRAPLRWAVAIACAINLMGLYAMLIGVKPSMWPAVLIAGIGLALLYLFARRPDGLWEGAAAVICMLIVNELLMSVGLGARRRFFHSGSALIGWLFGLLIARLVARAQNREGSLPPSESERFAELGTAATLGATYLGSAISKLSNGGLAWLGGGALRSALLCQHRNGVFWLLDHYADWVGGSATVASAFAVLTVLSEASMVFYAFGIRPRKLTATLILGMHLNILLLTGILYGMSIFLVALFGYPWPRWIPAWRRHTVPIARERIPLPKTLLPATLSVVLLAAILSVLGFRAGNANITIEARGRASHPAGR